MNGLGTARRFFAKYATAGLRFARVAVSRVPRFKQPNVTTRVETGTAPGPRMRNWIITKRWVGLLASARRAPGGSYSAREMPRNVDASNDATMSRRPWLGDRAGSLLCRAAARSHLEGLGTAATHSNGPHT